MAQRLLVFVCTGNMCRSPMAEYLLKNELGPDSEWDVSSAGTMTGNGFSASQAAIEALSEYNINLAHHRSRQLDDSIVYSAKLIVVMTEAHAEWIEQFYPEVADKIYLLGSFNPSMTDQNIDDPIGLSLEAYRKVRTEIEKSLPGLISFMNNLD